MRNKKAPLGAFFLIFYFIPVLLTGFYLSARHAITTAVLSSGFVVYCPSSIFRPTT